MPPRRRSSVGQTQNTKRRKLESPKQAPEKLPSIRIRYFDKDSISEHLHCPICQEVFNYPIALQCGHVFCNSCIHQWLSAQHQRTCPECRMIVDMRYAHKDLTAHKFLDSVQVYCSFLGCSWIGRMDALQSHSSECECNPAKLPEYMVSKDPAAPSSSLGVEDEPGEGTTSLRMKLFRGEKRDLLTSVASGSRNIFSASASEGQEPRIAGLSELASGLLTSSDVISRNKATADFIDLSSDEE